MDCLEQISKATPQTRKCLDTCKSVLNESKHKFYKCNVNDLFIKVGDIGASLEEQQRDDFHITKEYQNYLKIHSMTPDISNMFVDVPILYKDDIGLALIFDNRNEKKSVDIYHLIKQKQIDLILNNLIPRIRMMIEKLNSNKICHGDIHFGNIVYNIVRDELHFIDLEKMSFDSEFIPDLCNDITNLDKFTKDLIKFKNKPNAFLKKYFG